MSGPSRRSGTMRASGTSTSGSRLRRRAAQGVVCASSRSGRFRRATSFCPRSPLRRCYSRRSRTSAATNVLRAQKSSADAPRVSSPGSRARALPRPRAAAGFCRCSCLPCMLSGAAGSCAAQPRCEVDVVRPPRVLAPVCQGSWCVRVCARACSRPLPDSLSGLSFLHARRHPSLRNASGVRPRYCSPACQQRAWHTAQILKNALYIQCID